MGNKDYEQKKKKCWLQFCREKGIYQEVNIDIYEAFDFIFDRAYALGKQTETVTQGEIEKAANEFADREYEIGEVDWDALHKGYYHGMKDALGKQEKDADTVIQGWVARDKRHNALNLHAEKPYRAMSGYRIDSKHDWWDSECASFLPLDKHLFPDLTWESDPEEVEIILKRKKNGNIQ